MVEEEISIVVDVDEVTGQTFVGLSKGEVRFQKAMASLKEKK